MYLTPRVNEDQTPPRIRHAITAWTVPQGWTEWAVHPTRIERGESRLTHHLRAAAIAQALGCKVEDIFYVDKKQQSA